MNKVTAKFEKIEKVFGNTPKKDVARIEKARKEAIEEIVGRHLPGITLRVWSPRDGRTFNMMTAGIVRIYLSRAGEPLGFVGVKRSARSGKGSYEAHRRAKGEDLYSTEFECTLEEDIEEALRAATVEYLTRTDALDRMAYDDQFEYTFGALIYTKPFGC
jgi:hypothetical protein